MAVLPSPPQILGFCLHLAFTLLTCLRPALTRTPDMPKTFGAWLKAQQKRNDDVGDLAQDFIRDIKRTPYRRPSDWTPSKLFWRMKARRASATALCVWRMAKREWKGSL